MQPDGHHLVADFWNCRLPGDPDGWRRVIRAAVEAMGVTLLRLDVHTFCPQGITAVAMLAESHLAVHTWPERGYVAIDIFTCGAPARTEAGIEVLRRELQPEQRRILKIERGGPPSRSSFEEFTCGPAAEGNGGRGQPCR